MKRLKGFSTGAIVAIVIVLAVLVLGTIMIIKHNSEAVDYDQYASVSIIEASDDNGQIADHIRGDANAPVIITEYANFQCNHCADLNPYVEQVVADSNGQLAVVFRNMVWSAFPNSRAAAAAAEAAGLQGYWEPYANLLFEKQVEWGNATGSDRTALFENYFTEITNGEGDLEKFRADVASDAVKQKIDFDNGIAKITGVQGTPAFYYDGQLISLEGGDINVDGQTVTIDPVPANDVNAFKKVFQDIINAKLNSQQ